MFLIFAGLLYIYMDITNHLKYIYIYISCIINYIYISRTVLCSIYIYTHTHIYIYICIGYHNILKVQTEGVDTLHHITLHKITLHHIPLHYVTLYIYRCIRIRSYKHITVCVYIYMGMDQYLLIITIFRGMNIHLPAILMWTTGVQGFDTLPYINMKQLNIAELTHLRYISI